MEKRLTNMYYSQYDSFMDSEPYYDSDNLDSLQQSPTHAEYLEYVKCRKDEELNHELWKEKLISEKRNWANQIEEYCGMSVDLRNDRVCYIYRHNDNYIPDIKFKITIVYIRLLRKWYISFGRSRVPGTVNIHNKLREGTDNPIGKRVLNLVRKCNSLMEVYSRRLISIYKLINGTKETYKDLEFEMNESLTSLRAEFKGSGWPVDLEKITPDSVLAVELELDVNLSVASFTYEYKCSYNVPAREMKIYLRELEKKLQIFFSSDLKEAFVIFMNGQSSSVTESSERD
ncbi:uncharacterized protein LOC143207431 [Lasioglossum baleicum]|uniref:uncharacterized protein LOC143207431 n=1 Tax=Lasioglossum baleicum TaxID=434251 RepID=UPI003FCDD7BE